MDMSEHLRYLAKNIRKQDVIALSSGLGLHVINPQTVQSKMVTQSGQAQPNRSVESLEDLKASTWQPEITNAEAIKAVPILSNPPSNSDKVPAFTLSKSINKSSTATFLHESQPERGSGFYTPKVTVVKKPLGKIFAILAIDLGFILSCLVVLSMVFYLNMERGEGDLGSWFHWVGLRGLARLPLFQTVFGFLIITCFYALLFRVIVGATLGEAVMRKSTISNKTKRHYNNFN